MSSAIHVPQCAHDWQRSPERDRSYGHHQLPGPEYSVLVFWCRKCLKVEGRRVDYNTDRDPAMSREGA